MSLPYFFVADLQPASITLDEDTSKHVVSVLRMNSGEELLLTDGRGLRVRARITDDNRKRCTVRIEDRQEEPPRPRKVRIGISLVKNASRFEWFLEKATELGVSEILPLICERTEKEKFRQERLQGILVSALLQSQQCWLPLLHEPLPFAAALQQTSSLRLIAHCLPEEKTELASLLHQRPADAALLLVGPEGDFTAAEIDAARKAGFLPVALGSTRLRTETAGLAAAVLLCQG